MASLSLNRAGGRLDEAATSHCAAPPGGSPAPTEQTVQSGDTICAEKMHRIVKEIGERGCSWPPTRRKWGGDSGYSRRRDSPTSGDPGRSAGRRANRISSTDATAECHHGEQARRLSARALRVSP